MEYMEYAELKQLSEENRKVIISYLERLKLTNLKTFDDFKNILVAIIDDFADFKLSLDEFSTICGNLLLILQQNINLENAYIDKVQLQDYLLMGDDISWEIRREPVKAGESLFSLINLSESLKKELFDNNLALDKYPILEPLNQDERRLIFNYLELLRLSKLTGKDNIQKIFIAIMSDFMKGSHYLQDMLNICRGLLKILDAESETVNNDEFVRTLIASLKVASEQAEDPKIWWQNARQLISLYKEVRRDGRTDEGRYSPPLDANRGNDPRI